MRIFVVRLLFSILLFGILHFLNSCQDGKANSIVNEVIETHGGSAFESFLLEFDFRNTHFTAARNKGIFIYTREFKDSTGTIKDVLNNEGLTRYRNNSILPITDERKEAFTRSINSVIYFALLPFGLNDAAVNKEWIRETSINGESYDLVRVTFDKIGGGEGHEDVFLYWFHQNKNTMDYMAYSYDTDGGGLRFRQAINPRKIGGILFQDYVNYKPSDESIPIEELESMFIAGSLEKLSEIKLENVTVTEYKENSASKP